MHRFVAHVLTPLLSLTLLSDFVRAKLCVALGAAVDFVACILFLVRSAETGAELISACASESLTNDLRV